MYVCCEQKGHDYCCHVNRSVPTDCACLCCCFFLVGLFSVAPLALLAIPSLHAPSTLWFRCAFTAVSVFGCHWVKGWDLASQPFLALVAFPFGLTVCQRFVVPHGAGKRVGRMSCKALGNQKTFPCGDVWVFLWA